MPQAIVVHKDDEATVRDVVQNKHLRPANHCSFKFDEMSQLNTLLVEHFIQPLQNLPYSVVCIIDCLNAATMYPQFFHRVDNDPNTFYIFVTRGKFSEARRGKFKTTCPGVKTVAFPNVMVLSCCSSYMYTRRLNTSSRCSLECKIPEGLFNVWSKSSGSGGPRFPDSLTRLNEMAM